MLLSEKLQKIVWTKAEHVVKIEKEYCKENCIDRSVIEPTVYKLIRQKMFGLVHI